MAKNSIRVRFRTRRIIGIGRIIIPIERAANKRGRLVETQEQVDRRRALRGDVVVLHAGELQERGLGVVVRVVDDLQAEFGRRHERLE